jgi:hypothetical protein
MRRFPEFENVKQNAEGQASVREIIVAIERLEIRNIYGGDILEFTIQYKASAFPYLSY